MEYAKENAECTVCKCNKDLYAAQCKHLDPICIACATNMAKNKTPCSTCQQLVTKVSRRYELKPCAPGNTIKFLAKFSPKLGSSVNIVGVDEPAAAGASNTDKKHFRKSDKRKWIMYREAAERKRNNLKTDTTPWILENVKDKGKYKGKAKPVDPNMYYMVQFDSKRMGDPLVVYPIKSWYEFESEIQYKTLTTEEAENMMKSRKKNEEGQTRWIKKGRGENDKMEDVDGQHEDDETRKQKQIKEEDDSDNEEEEEISNPDENDLPKGEDWEHDEEFTDDDLSASSEDSESEGVPSDMSDFEDEKVTESGKEIKNILKKQQLGEKDVQEPVENAENNDASIALNEKDCHDGKDKKKAKKKDDEMKDVKNAEKPRTEPKQKKRKATEEKQEDSEANQSQKKTKHTSEGKSQESEAQQDAKNAEKRGTEQKQKKRKATEEKQEDPEANQPQKRKATKEKQEDPEANQPQKKTKHTSEWKSQESEAQQEDPEANQPQKKTEHTSEGKSQEPEAQKEDDELSHIQNLYREFLKAKRRDPAEMKKFMQENLPGEKEKEKRKKFRDALLEMTGRDKQGLFMLKVKKNITRNDQKI